MCAAGDERWQARGWAAAGVLLSLGTTLMLVVVSYVHRDMETAMSGKDQGVGPLQDACDMLCSSSFPWQSAGSRVLGLPIIPMPVTCWRSQWPHRRRRLHARALGYEELQQCHMRGAVAGMRVRSMLVTFVWKPFISQQVASMGRTCKLVSPMAASL